MPETANAEDALGPETDARGTVDLLGHVLLPADELLAGGNAPNNIIVAAKSETGRWAEASMRLIGPSRSRFRSVYFQWSMAINGLHVAAEKYADPKWQSGHAFTISGIREGAIAQLARWDGKRAADSHLATIPKMAAWGFIEMYSVLETFVFDVYRCFVDAHPDHLLQGDDFRELRKLRRAAEADAAKRDEWIKAWRERADNWQRKRLYDSLHRVFLSYVSAAGLKAPKAFTKTGPQHWAETIEALAITRHCLIHGAETVPSTLAAFTGKPHALGFDFVEGTPLRVGLLHLQKFELFSEQLLDALNLSMVEHGDAGK